MILKYIFRHKNPDFLNRDLEKLTPKDIMFRKAIYHSGFKFGLLLLSAITFIGVFVPFFVDMSMFRVICCGESEMLNSSILVLISSISSPLCLLLVNVWTSSCALFFGRFRGGEVDER